MGELLEGFISQFDNDADNVSLEKLMTSDERLEWETLVKCFNDINIVEIAKTVKNIPKVYKLSRHQDLAILAYIKTLEMMVAVARDNMGAQEEQEHSDYDGSMFG